MAQQVLQIQQRLLGDSSPYYAQSLADLALLYRKQRDYARAEPLYVTAIEINKKALGENHPGYAASLNNLGYLYQYRGDYARAEPLFVRGLRSGRRPWGRTTPRMPLASTILPSCTKPKATTRGPSRCTVRHLMEAFGENHPGYAGALNNLAKLYKLKATTRGPSRFTARHWKSIRRLSRS